MDLLTTAILNPIRPWQRHWKRPWRGAAASVLAAMACVVSLTAVTPVRAESASLVDEALWVGQTERVMATLSQALVDTLTATPQLARLKPEQRERLGAAMSRAYAPARFVRRVRELMSEQLSDDELREFIALSSEPLAQRALEMEIVSSTANPSMVERHARSIATDPESIARINAVRRLDLASGGTEMMLAITVSSVLSSVDMQRRLQVEGEAASTERGKPVPIDPHKRRAQVSREELERLTRSLRPKVHREVVNGGLFAYRWLPLEELNAYALLHERPAMRKVSMLINEAIGSVFMVAQTEALERILLELLGKGETPA